jgi:hypothetical protein
MPVPYSTEDLEQVFDAKILTRSRFMAEMTEVELQGDTIIGTVSTQALTRTMRITPAAFGRRVSFAERECSCGEAKCVHLAATAIKALERFPSLRKAAPKTMLDTIVPATERPYPQTPPRMRPAGRARP